MGLAYQIDGPFTMTSGEALVDDRLVKASASTLVYADAGDEPIGLTKRAVASGAIVSCEPLNGQIKKVTGSKAISACTDIYWAADGKVSDAAVGKQIGILLTAITADGGRGAAIIWGPRGGNDMLSAKGSNVEIFDDFFTFDDGDDWIDTVTDAGTIDITDAVGGVLSIATGGTTENESYVSSIAEAFKFQTDKKLFFETRIKLAEANDDDANWIIGLSDTVAADSLLDSGAGPMASYDGAVFFKVLDGTKIQFETSNAAAQVTNATLGDWASATWFKLGFLYDYGDGTTGSITPYVDGVAGTAHAITIAGLAEMHILMGAKAGDANAETLLVDYAHVVMER